MISLTILAILGIFQSSSAYTEAALADQITNLPGAELLDVQFNQFSGYIQIPGATSNSKNAHYWFVESMNDPANDPLTFWTNGGPGCSGLIGFFTEQGPFRPNEDLTLSLAQYPWNKVSNMVFIESPVDVGFSYSDYKSDLITGDNETAMDNYLLIQGFLAKFPDLKSNPLYATSESYGGHYLPTLAKTIVDQNTAGDYPTLNFKGFAVGNPYTTVYSGTDAGIDTFWGHQLVPKPLYDDYLDACGKSRKLSCSRLTYELEGIIGDLNPYALDYPVCLKGTPAKQQAGRAQRLTFKHHQLASMGEMSPEMAARYGMPLRETYEPCEDNYALRYLNQDAVKNAIHVKGDITWKECSYDLKYSMADGQVSTAPIYNYLIDGNYGLDILVYSGDDDSVCATIGTQSWIWDLGYTVSSTNWEDYTVAGQTAGYITKWKNTKLALATVHGAGHEVPTYKPEVALYLFEQYLQGALTDQ